MLSVLKTQGMGYINVLFKCIITRDQILKRIFKNDKLACILDTCGTRLLCT